VADAGGVGEAGALVEEVSRDVGEDDRSGSPVERAERDQAVAAADVKQGLASNRLGAVQHRLAERGQQICKCAGSCLLVPRESPLAQPARPAVT
jgi:hypothetical protein